MASDTESRQFMPDAQIEHDPTIGHDEVLAEVVSEEAIEAPPTEGTAAWLQYAKELGPGVFALVFISLSLPGILGTWVLAQSAFFPETVRPWIEANAGIAPYLVFLGIGIATGSAIMPTYALAFACGVFFGFAVGGPIAWGGVVLGSMVGYGWGALLARKRVMHVIEAHERAKIVRAALLDRAWWSELMVITLLRFPPNSPFALTNLVMSSTRVNIGAYIVGTALGIMPRTLFAVWVGSQVGDITQAQTAGGRWRVVIGLAIGIVVFIILYKVFSKWAKDALARELGKDS